jgi:hypothetical protein
MDMKPIPMKTIRRTFAAAAMLMVALWPYVGADARAGAREAVGASGDAAVVAAGAVPRYRDVTIPAGTILSLTLDTAVGSDTSRVEQPVSARVRRAVRIGDALVVPAGSAVSGSVVGAERSGRVKGRARVAMRFHSLRPAAAGESYRIRTGVFSRVAPGTKKRDAVTIVAPAAGGAIIGGIAGGKKGAAIGTAVGGGAGTAAVLATRGKEVRLARGSAIAVRLLSPVTVRVRSGA